MALLKGHKTVRQALNFISLHPHWPSDDAQARLDMPVWELVCRNLFDIANYPDTANAASLARATRAQKLILDRLTGTRRMGTSPAVRNSKTLELLDLTGDIPEPETVEAELEEDDERPES